MSTSPIRLTHRFSRLALFTLALVLALAACAPRATPQGGGVLDSPAARELEQVATIAYHRMEIGFLQSGEYTTNALIDLDLPQGAKWTLEEFSTTDYLLRFTSSEVPGYAWLVSPSGVRIVSLEG